MELGKDIILDDYYKLRIRSKKLNSGRYQVKFFATVHQKKDLYGYLLVESDETLKSVISKIRKRLKRLEGLPEYQHIHLYNIGHSRLAESNFLIFE